MQKIYFIFLFSLLLIALSPAVIQANPCDASQMGPPAPGTTLPIVPCGNDASCPCEISDFFLMLANIYTFLVWTIATPLAVLALTIGGIFMLVSAGNPNLFGTGKKIIFVAIIGLVLTFCSWLIINFILSTTLGYDNWNTL